jgi:hypothetical protein
MQLHGTRGSRIGNGSGSCDRLHRIFAIRLSSAPNNPPVYDVIPMGEMGLKAWLKKHGFGRFQP